MPAPYPIRSARLLLILFFAVASLYYMSRSYERIPIPPTEDSFQPGGKRPAKPPSQYPLQQHPPIATEIEDLMPGVKPQRGKMRAAFVTLIRNSELWEIVKSIRQMEDRFNRHYHYPWVFLNDEPFTEEFINTTSALISGKAKYGMLRREGRC